MGVILATTLFLTACGGGSPSVDSSTGSDAPAKPSADAPAEKNDEPEVLSIWTYFSENEQRTFGKLADQFAADNNVNVVVEYIPFGDYKKQISVALASDSLPDIIMIDNPDHAAFASMGVFEDITEQMNAWEGKDHYFEGPLKSTMLDDKYYGIPVTSNCLALFYNEDMLEAAGVVPPTNWTELQETAKALTTPDVFGLGVASPKSEEATFQFLPWMIAADGSYDALNSPGTIKAVTLWADMIEAGSVSKETINWGQGDIQKQFSAGKLAMFVGGPWMMSQIDADAPDINWNVAKIPQDVKFASVLGGENMGIVKGNNVELAWEFLQYLGDFDTVKDFISQTGYFPPRKDVAQDSIWTEDPIKNVFMDQMQYAMPRGPHEKWPEISAAIYTALQESLTFNKTPEEALNDAQVIVDGLLNK